jgi:hypothetical protein
MTHERKADLDGKLADLEHEIFLALKQGAFAGHAPFQWKAIIRDGDTIGAALLTIVVIRASEDAVQATLDPLPAVETPRPPPAIELLDSLCPPLAIETLDSPPPLKDMANPGTTIGQGAEPDQIRFPLPGHGYVGHGGFTEPRCRNWLKAQNQPYPKSVCEICGSIVAPNWRCRYGIEG